MYMKLPLFAPFLSDIHLSILSSHIQSLAKSCWYSNVPVAYTTFPPPLP